MGTLVDLSSWTVDVLAVVVRVPGFAPAADCRLPSPSACCMAHGEHGQAPPALVAVEDLRFTVVDTVNDTVSMPTLTPLRDSIRARDENCLFTVGAPEEMHGRR